MTFERLRSMGTPKRRSTETGVPFAKAFAELEAITAWFERDDVDLGEGVRKFERGMALAAELRERLRTAEVKIAEIQKRFDASEVV